MSRNGIVTGELNYVLANRFYVEIGSDIKASFTECSGIGAQIDKEVYQEGGVNNQQRVFLKQAKFNDVTLKRGITNDLTFWEWMSGVLDNIPKKRLNVNILLFNQAGETMQSWTLIGAIPVGWKAPAFQANSNTAAIEELTLAYEGLKMKKSNSNRIQGQERDVTGFFGSN
ncbi:MAG: phage tail protein [Prochloraceae cyanobacterium]|nr:phage tail protein [Prochloraceae cyanobacterium]